MNGLYNTVIRLYATAARCVALRRPKVKKMIEGQKETLRRLSETISPDDRPVWIHAASLGEFEQGRPLIEKLKEEDPSRKIVLSFFSPSGYEVRKNYNKVDAVVYLPFDTPENARGFIDALNPSVAIFVKYEFWGNYLETLFERGIPTFLISAIFRRGQIFFRPYGAMMRRVLTFFDKLYIQDENSRNLLESIGVDNSVIAGDTRFDRVRDVMESKCNVAGIEKFNNGRGADIIFGSSWPADEANYIDWLNANPEVSFIIAPHEFDDERLKKLRDSLQGNVVLLSQWEEMFRNPGNGPRESSPANIRGLIVDSFGKLSSLYRYGRIAYIGGGFGTGIHNINEAAVYGIPVVFGPKYKKFKEACDLVELGGAFACGDSRELHRILYLLTADGEVVKKAGEISRSFIIGNLGATERIYADIFGEG